MRLVWCRKVIQGYGIAGAVSRRLPLVYEEGYDVRLGTAAWSVDVTPLVVAILAHCLIVQYTLVPIFSADLFSNIIQMEHHDLCFPNATACLKFSDFRVSRTIPVSFGDRTTHPMTLSISPTAEIVLLTHSVFVYPNSLH
jgi:hypothetical protein